PHTDACPQQSLDPRPFPYTTTGTGPYGWAAGTGSAPARHAVNINTAAFTGNDLRIDRRRGGDVAGSTVPDRTSLSQSAGPSAGGRVVPVPSWNLEGRSPGLTFDARGSLL